MDLAPGAAGSAAGGRSARRALVVLGAWGVATTTVVAMAVYGGDPDPDHRAIISMALGLILVWCVLGGVLMRIFREPLVRCARRLPVGWRTR